MEIQLLKQQQRKLCRERVLGLSSAEKEAAGRSICKSLEQLMVEIEKDTVVKTVFSFLPTAEEPDLDDLHMALMKAGKTLAFPVSFPKGVMEAYAPQSPEDLQTGMYGILAPVIERSIKIHPEDIDIIIVPAMGVDGNKRRLGHGGGYYDRFLPLAKRAKKVLVAFDIQKLDEIATESTDETVDYVVTEKTVY